MVKISRYILVCVAIVALSIAIPRLYWISFENPIKAPSVFYSCIDNEFYMIRPQQNSIKTNEKGDEISRDDFEKLLPLNYSRQLSLNGTMPDSVNGVEMDLHEINRNRSFFRIRPKEMDTPQPSLFPLFESKSGRANLEMPEDFFRITWRMEFIEAKSNSINEEKSRMFSAVLYNRGFQFPAKTINGIPTTRKSCDEGYLVLDSKNQLFHIKMVKGKPFVKKVDVPEGLQFKQISCVDFSDKLYYAYLFSANNEIFVLTQYDYMLEKLEIENILPEKDEVRISGDLFNYNITSIGDGYIKTSILDKNFNFVDEYTETWLTKEERKEGKIARLLFPFEIKLNSKNSDFVNFYFQAQKTVLWLVLSLVLLIIQILILRKKSEKIKNHLLDLGFVALAGIFGFIAVNVFPNKFFN